jgi:MFS family permease
MDAPRAVRPLHRRIIPLTSAPRKTALAGSNIKAVVNGDACPMDGVKRNMMRSLSFWLMVAIGAFALLLTLRVLPTIEGRELSHWMMTLGMFSGATLISLSFALVTLLTPAGHPRAHSIILVLYVLALIASVIGGGMWGVVGHVMTSQKLALAEAFNLAQIPMLIFYLLALGLLLGGLSYAVKLRRTGPPVALPLAVTTAPLTASATPEGDFNPYQAPRSGAPGNIPKPSGHPLGKPYLVSHGLYGVALLIIVLILAAGGSDLASSGGLLLLAYMTLPMLNSALLLWSGRALQRVGLATGGLLIIAFIGYGLMRIGEGATVPRPVVLFSGLILLSLLWSYAKHRALAPIQAEPAPLIQ